MGLLLVAACLPVPQAGAQSSGVLEGTVSEGAGGVEGVLVILYSDERVLTSFSDRLGNFSFTELPAHPRYLEVSAKGMVVSAKGFGTATIPITGSTPQPVSFDLRPRIGGGPPLAPPCGPNHVYLPRPEPSYYEDRYNEVSLVGSVGDSEGKPAAGATVRLIQAGGIVVGVPPEVLTDERGEFQFKNIQPGWYELKAIRDSNWFMTKRFWIARGNLTRISMIGLYPDGVFPICSEPILANPGTPQVREGEVQLPITVNTIPSLNPLPQKVRAAQCLYLWRCGVRPFESRIRNLPE